MALLGRSCGDRRKSAYESKSGLYEDIASTTVRDPFQTSRETRPWIVNDSTLLLAMGGRAQLADLFRGSVREGQS
jgi:hypothetical protein